MNNDTLTPEQLYFLIHAFNMFLKNNLVHKIMLPAEDLTILEFYSNAIVQGRYAYKLRDKPFVLDKSHIAPSIHLSSYNQYRCNKIRKIYIDNFCK